MDVWCDIERLEIDCRVDRWFGSCERGLRGGVVSRGRQRLYGYVELKDKSDWVSVCRKLQVKRTKGKGRGIKTWNIVCEGSHENSWFDQR